MQNLINLFLIFISYSFIGYICEIVYMTLENKKFANRGFLCGPLLPIYGSGAIFITLLLSRFKNNAILVFLLGMIICSALEYFVGFVLEKIFHNKWWDYYDVKFNLNGRICLENSILFGIGALVIVYITSPVVDKLLNVISTKFLNISATIIFIIFLLDIIYSVVVAFNLRNRLIIVEELKKDKISKIPLLFEKALKARVANFKIYPTRLLKAFPTIDTHYFKEFSLMKKFSKNGNKEKISKHHKK